MKIRNSLLIITILVVGTLKATAVGTQTTCTEPAHTAPTATTSNWKADTANEVEFLGQANANNYPTTAWFEYGDSDSLNSNTGFIYVGEDNQSIDVNIAAEDLRPNTTYYYRIVSKNKLGTVRGEIKTLKTMNQ